MRDPWRGTGGDDRFGALTGGSGAHRQVPAWVGDGRRGRRAAPWLLLIPTAAPLAVPLMDRHDPVLWGMPFFYWYQLGCAALATGVITLVYRLSGRRR